MRNANPRFSSIIHRTTLLAIVCGASACDVDDQDLLEGDEMHADADADADADAESDLEAGCTVLADAPHPSAAPLPVYKIAPPIHADDLAHNHYIQINRDKYGGPWHDMAIVRFDDLHQKWTAQREATNTEQEALGWDIPIYAGVAGEIIACWRNAPYDIDYQPALEQLGGNYIVIRTADNRYVYYAHMQTNSIPAALCPNESATGWYDDVTDLRAGSNIPAEAYVEESERVQVSVGQHIGRMGAHGNADGTHLHIHAGDVTSNARGVVSTSSPTYDLDFSDVWYQTADALPNGTNPWTFAAPGVIPALALNSSLRVWPSYKHEATFSEAPKLGDFNHPGGVDDLLCHDAGTGGQWLDFGELNGINGTDWNGSGQDFCSNRTQRLHKGDFDGDGRQDLLCHDQNSGQRWVRYANNSGNFQDVTTYKTAADGWCALERQQLHVGDFNGDHRDDLLCHNTIAGQRYIDFSAPFYIADTRQMPFAGTDVSRVTPWCNGYFQRLHIGGFDGNFADDLLCHDTRSGTMWLDYAGGATVFDGTDFSVYDNTWCNDGGERMILGEFAGNGRDDLLCHDTDDGDLEVRASQNNAIRFLKTATWKRDNSGWCTAPYQRLRAGDIGGGYRTDLLCHDQKSGALWADYTEFFSSLTQGGLQGTDWSQNAGWCAGNTQGLH